MRIQAVYETNDGVPLGRAILSKSPSVGDIIELNYKLWRVLGLNQGSYLTINGRRYTAKVVIDLDAASMCLPPANEGRDEI